jgi:MoaD family protein
MIKVKVKSFLTMEEIIGNSEVTLDSENATVDELLKELSKRYGERFKKQIFNPKTGQVQSYWIVVNGQHRQELETKLNNGDEVILYPTWAGG